MKIKRLPINTNLSRLVILLIGLMGGIASAQSTKISGIVVDATTAEPLMGVAVYISGTSTGVVTGPDGTYNIIYSPAYNAPLVFAFLGYEKIQIENPIDMDLSRVKMTEQTNTLEAVVIDPDPWDRATKEELFLNYFVGKRSREDATVLNLKDVKLRFNPSLKQLIAFASNPILLKNEELGYLITYDLAEFEVNFKFIPNSTDIEKVFRLEHARDRYIAENSFVSGTSFYREFPGKKPTERQRERRRKKAFSKSHLRLFRSIISEQLNEANFELFYDGFKVKPEDHIRVRRESDEVYQVTFRNLKYSIRDRDGNQTDMYLSSNYMYIDRYGNNLSPRELMLSGYIPELGVGGMMPMDYDYSVGQ
ncbi:carboxypeptidase-like regulatory domain-containing protein [Nonlabens marinus]|nr:carboxypeptidase-like regulatory domain-containing protein [Nonlabens marinus]